MKKTKACSQQPNHRCDYVPRYGCDQQFVPCGLHSHDFYELYIHFSGADLFHVENNIYNLAPDQLIIIPPFQMHGITREHTLYNYERISLYVSPELLRSIGRNMLDIEDFLLQTIAQKHIQYQLSSGKAIQCKSLIREMLDETDSSSVGKYANYSRMLNFIRIVCETILSSDHCHAPATTSSQIHAVLSHINAHFTENFTLDQLAKEFMVSTSYLSHEFSKYTGKSIYEYILSKRIALAKEMIPALSIPMHEIAERCGFRDYSNFLRSFKAQTKISPSDYRKNLSQLIYTLPE